jgi:FtsP/CotA-like multicopper oxidase with cupredoxin domain
VAKVISKLSRNGTASLLGAYGCGYEPHHDAPLKVGSPCHLLHVEDEREAPTALLLHVVVRGPPMGSVTIAFDANNPGRWELHCHNLYHMMTGMMTEVRYPAII